MKSKNYGYVRLAAFAGHYCVAFSRYINKSNSNVYEQASVAPSVQGRFVRR